MIDTPWAGTRAQVGFSAVMIQVIANNVMHFDALTKDSLVNSEKYAAMIYVLDFKSAEKIIKLLVYLQLHFQSVSKHYLRIFKWNIQSCNQTCNTKKNLVTSA